MTPAQAELLHHFRREITAMQLQMDGFQEREMRLLEGSKDVTEAAMSDLAGRIAKLEALVEKHDPEGFTTLVR